MSKIKFLALGGLDEKAKNLYVLEIDSKIYIIDSGLYEPLTNDFGIQSFIPKLDYLELNKDKIQGIFLSTAVKQQIGALIKIVELIPNIKIYGSELTLYSIRVFFPDLNIEEDNLIKLIPNEEITLGVNLSLYSFELPSSIPQTLGFVFKTPDGNIIYLINYIYDVVREYGVNVLDNLIKLKSEKNLLFLTDSFNSDINDSISPHYRVKQKFEKYFKSGNYKRIVASIYEEEIINIIEMMQLAKENKYKISFVCCHSFSLIKHLIQNSIIENFDIKVFSENQYEENELIIQTGTKTDLYTSIFNVIANDDVSDFKYSKKDLIALVSPPQAGNEHVFASITNEFSRLDIDIVKTSSSEKPTMNPSLFDLENYYNFILPEYIIPIKGFYKEMLLTKNKLESIGFNKENLIITFNNVIHTWENGVYKKDEVRKIKDGGATILSTIDNSNVDNSIIEEREKLAKNGVAIISTVIDKDRNIISNIDIQMRGVIYIKNQDSLLEELSVNLKTVLETDELKTKPLNQIIAIFDKQANKLIKANTKKTPYVITQIKELWNEDK